MILQHIVTHWDKSHRTPRQGAVRAALPDRYPLPPLPPPGDDIALHAVERRAATGYEPVETLAILPAKAAVWGLEVRRGDGAAAEIHFRYPLWRIGLPGRPGLNGLIARLPAGRSLVLRVNGRSKWSTSLHGSQTTYQEHVFRLADVAPEAFDDTPIHRDINERVVLY